MNYLWFLAVPLLLGCVWGTIEFFKDYLPNIKQFIMNRLEHSGLTAIFFGLLLLLSLLLYDKSNMTYILGIISILGIIFSIIGLYFRRQKNTRNNLKRMMSREIEFNNESDIFDIDNMEGHEFEYYCAELLENYGFGNVSVTPGSGDQGVDIVATKNGERYAIQCKRYSSPLGNKPVQEVYTGKVFYDCKHGIVITNSTFTPHAKELAKKTGVLLWDRNILQKMIHNSSKKTDIFD